MKWSPYTSVEARLIIEHYPDIEKLLVLLSPRPRQSIVAKIRRLGLSSAPPRWTLTEDKFVRRHYPDFAHIQARLPHRTHSAIQTRARDLGITRKLKRWTPERLEVLTRISGLVSEAQASLIIGCSISAISNQLYRMRLTHKAVEGPARDGWALVRDIRAELTARELSMKWLIKLHGCRELFPASGRRPSLKSATRAVRALGGELYAEWED